MGRTQLDLASAEQVQGALPASNGGTGQTTLGSNTVLLGNGTSPVNTIAAGTLGNVVYDNGTTWVSHAPTGGGGGRTFAFFAG